MAVRRSQILADLLCLLEAEPGTLGDHKWIECAKRICPKALLGTPPHGFLDQAAVSAIGIAKAICEERLQRLEADFKPLGFEPARLLTESEGGDFWSGLANTAFTELEKALAERDSAATLPDRVHEVFAKSWFSYLCLAFYSEIKENQKVANIFIAMRQEIGFERLGKGLDKLDLTVRAEGKATRRAVRREGKAIRGAILKRLNEIDPKPDPSRVYDTTAYFKFLRSETRQIELHELKVESDETPEPGMDALYFPLMTTAHTDERRAARKKKKTELTGRPEPIPLEKALEDRRLIIEVDPAAVRPLSCAV